MGAISPSLLPQGERKPRAQQFIQSGGSLFQLCRWTPICCQFSRWPLDQIWQLLVTSFHRSDRRSLNESAGPSLLRRHRELRLGQESQNLHAGCAPPDQLTTSDDLLRHPAGTWRLVRPCSQIQVMLTSIAPGSTRPRKPPLSSLVTQFLGSCLRHHTVTQSPRHMRNTCNDGCRKRVVSSGSS